jgi:peptidyl-prolyl cis-trans isomerase C
MKKQKKLELIFPAVFAVALFALPCANAASANAATNTPASTATNGNSQAAMTALFGDPVIARSKGFEIKRSELDEVMTGIKSTALARGQTITPGQLTQIEGRLLDQLIQVQLLLQKTTDADKSNGVQKADLQMKALLERFGSQEVFERQMKAAGMTAADLRTKIVQKLTAEAALLRELNITVTDAEAKQFYDDTNHSADFEQPEMVHVRHILSLTVDPVTHVPLTADQQQAKRKQIDDLLKRIRGGADFTALAKQYSEDPGSKNNGGEMPVFPRGQMAPEFEAAAFSLTNNQVSDVITTAYGYHIIKLLDKTPAKKLALNDKVPLSDTTVAAKIKDYLMQQKIGKFAPAYLEKLRKAADVEILDADLKAAAAAAAAEANAPDATPEN